MTSCTLWIARQVVKLGRLPNLSTQKLKNIYQNRSYPSPAKATWKARRTFKIVEKHHLGYVNYELQRKKGAQTGKRILYLHGGGFVRPLHWAHWNLCTELALSLNAEITLATYPLCPEYTRDECHHYLHTLYQTLAQDSSIQEIMISGDSAGGNLALFLALKVYQSSIKTPLSKVILFCPWVDLSMSNPDIDAIAQRDPMLTRSIIEEWGKWWAGDRDLKHPDVSPLFATFEGFPPVEFYLGSDDMLTPDALLLSDTMARAGIQVQTHVTAGAFHDFMAVTFTPEAKSVFRLIKEGSTKKERLG